MKIELKSNKKIYYIIAIPTAIIFGLFLLMILYLNLNGQFNISDDLVSFIIVVLFFLTSLTVIIFIIFYEGKRYIFSKDKIIINLANNRINEISVKQVETMHYYPFKLQYILTMFAGSLNEGGAMKIHIRMNDGSKYEIGFLSKKEAIVLKEKLYTDKLIIMFEKDHIN